MSGVGITGLIKPLNAGSFPVFEDIDGLGGFRTVADTTARDAIPANYRKVGMVVTVSAGTSYQLVGGITNANWVVYAAPLAITYNSAAQTQEPAINFLGNAVSVSDNPAVATNITIKSLGQVVATLAARNALPTANREVGTVAYEVDTDQTWRLIGGTSNANWQDITVYPVSGTVPGVVPIVGAVSTILQSTGTAAAWTIPLTWDPSVASPTIQQGNLTTNGATGQILNITGQNATGTTSTGGAVVIGSGTGTLAGVGTNTSPGAVTIKRGAQSVASWTTAGVDFLTLGLPSGSAGVAGNSAASAGNLRVTRNFRLNARNNGDSSDRLIIDFGVTNGTDAITIGDASCLGITYNTSAGHVWEINTAQVLSCTGTVFNVFVNTILLNGSVAGAQILTVKVTNSVGTQADLFLRASGTTNAAGNGGSARLQGGKGGSTGLNGGGSIQINVDDTAANMQSMVEVRQLLNGGQRVVSLCLAADVTLTQMPANTGDKVIFIANAATAPTASSVGGGILYATGGSLRYRSSSGVDTLIAA